MLLHSSSWMPASTCRRSASYTNWRRSMRSHVCGRAGLCLRSRHRRSLCSMNSQTFIQLAQLCTILIGFLGLAVSLRSHRRQMYAQMYIEFSARFHHVLRTFPAEIWIEDAIGDRPLPPRHEELSKSCLQCFHIM